MPRILAQQPAWIARGSSGHTLFQPDERAKAAQTDSHHDGPSRKIAHRGTEIFVAVDNELRWADTSALGDAGDEDEDGRLYRVLKTPTSRPIHQLSVSPSGSLIAILTSHTCHIALLPASTHLRSGDTSPLRLKTFQVGPTAHVLEQAELVSALWHPLSPSGNCLVTVTKDACVRLWELDASNRSTFDEPSLAVDLKKLANATSSTGVDFSASKYGVSTAFSPDNIEMQVAAACFGGQGREDEHGWSSMTLWLAMSEGDVYALCPLLPSRWKAPATLLPSLSTSVIAKARAASGDSGITSVEKRVVDQQCTWLADIDGQDPTYEAGKDEFAAVEVYARPAKPGPIPKLQGPFYMSSELDAGDVTDIFVIAPKTDDEAVYDDEYEDSGESDGLSVGVICLATNNSKVHICLDLDGVEAEWLPPKRSRAFTPDDDEERDLLLFEIIDLPSPQNGAEGWPTFTPSPINRYEVFVTTPSGAYHLDLAPWTTALEAELAGDSEAGVDFRLQTQLASAKTVVTRVATIIAAGEPDRAVNAAVAICDPASTSYTLLTSAGTQPFASLLELPLPVAHDYLPDDSTAVGALPAPEPRAPYEPAEAFYQASALPQLLKTAGEKRLLGADSKALVRFSPATLNLMTEAHRVMSSETHRLGLAAADLFRRCDRMGRELREQIRRVKDIAERVEGVVGGGIGDRDEEDGEGQGVGGREKTEHRVQRAGERNAVLNARVDELRRKMGRLGGTQLSAKELSFAAEVEKLQRSIEPAAPEAPTEPAALLHMDNSSSSKRQHEKEMAGSLTERFEAVRILGEKLKYEVEAAEARRVGGESGTKTAAVSGYRMKKLEQVRGLLERETALVEGVGERLARLSAGG